MSTKQEKIDATILGIIYHPEIRPVRPLSKQCKKDIATMIKTLIDSLQEDVPRCCVCGKEYEPDQEDRSWTCSWCH